MGAVTGKLRLGVRKKFFTWRVAGLWDRLPRAMVTEPDGVQGHQFSDI